MKVDSSLNVNWLIYELLISINIKNNLRVIEVSNINIIEVSYLFLKSYIE